MRHAHVLCLVHHDVVIGRVRALAEACGKAAEDLELGDEPLLPESRTNSIEDRPEEGALPFGKPRLQAEPSHVPIRLPAVELPGVHDLLPFAQ